MQYLFNGFGGFLVVILFYCICTFSVGVEVGVEGCMEHNNGRRVPMGVQAHRRDLMLVPSYAWLRLMGEW